MNMILGWYKMIGYSFFWEHNRNLKMSRLEQLAFNVRNNPDFREVIE